MLERRLFKDLLKYLSVFPVLSLIGPRNAGKTVLARSVMKWLGKQSVYLDLEFGPDHKKLDHPDIYFESFRQHCIVIDEIQRKSNLFKAMHKAIDDDTKDGMFLVILSVVSERLKKNTELLSGMTGYLMIHPLDRLEVLNESDMDTHWLRGGFPDSYLASSGPESFIIRDNLIRTHCERDLPQAGLRNDPFLIRSFLTMIATNQGDIWNASSFARSLGLTSPTVKKYLDLLEGSFLIYVLNPFVRDSTKRLVKAPKIYISDSGILHALLEIETEKELKNHIILGSSWEGYVIAQVRALLYRKVELYHYRTHQGAQIDLVIVKNKIPLMSIEIQTTNQPLLGKGFRIAIDDLKTDVNYIVTPSSANYRLSSNIQVIGLDQFLILLKEEFLYQKA